MALKRNICNFNFNFKHSTKGDTFQCVLRAIEKVSSNSLICSLIRDIINFDKKLILETGKDVRK